MVIHRIVEWKQSFILSNTLEALLTSDSCLKSNVRINKLSSESRSAHHLTGSQVITAYESKTMRDILWASITNENPSMQLVQLSRDLQYVVRSSLTCTMPASNPSLFSSNVGYRSAIE
ncbi:hypothetical protein J6590_008618 [Homalodisca vitripennis]|nr:hypothetical protein J6590_008618 [Homalodisca vitripennis]